jgi:hypothetical protein
MANGNGIAATGEAQPKMVTKSNVKRGRSGSDILLLEDEEQAEDEADIWVCLFKEADEADM